MKYTEKKKRNILLIPKRQLSLGIRSGILQFPIEVLREKGNWEPEWTLKRMGNQGLHLYTLIL